MKITKVKMMIMFKKNITQIIYLKVLKTKNIKRITNKMKYKMIINKILVFSNKHLILSLKLKILRRLMKKTKVL